MVAGPGEQLNRGSGWLAFLGTGHIAQVFDRVIREDLGSDLYQQHEALCAQLPRRVLAERLLVGVCGSHGHVGIA